LIVDNKRFFICACVVDRHWPGPAGVAVEVQWNLDRCFGHSAVQDGPPFEVALTAALHGHLDEACIESSNKDTRKAAHETAHVITHGRRFAELRRLDSGQLRNWGSICSSENNIIIGGENT
jgi:hypothetical protein